MPIEERILQGGVHAFISTNLEELGFLAAFTQRRGGQSEGSFRSLNLSFAVGDVPARVGSNRRITEAALGVEPPAWPEQVHGGNVGGIGMADRGAGARDLHGRIGEVDALFTRTRNVPIGVLVADCVPLILASPSDRAVAVVHAGWRGLAAGIVPRAVGRFSHAGDVRAAIGPSIGACHYEVGEDVAARVSDGSSVEAVTDRRDGHLFLDLGATARAVLQQRGVRDIDHVDLCTWCESDRFFSHRRDGGRTGRQAAIATMR